MDGVDVRVDMKDAVSVHASPAVSVDGSTGVRLCVSNGVGMSAGLKVRFLD